MSMNQLAQHILAVAKREGRSVTNLHLQKIMYFTLQRALKEEVLDRETLEELYDQSFLVWRYGPVVPAIYEKYSLYSASPIMISGIYNESFSTLDDIIKNLIEEKPFALVNMSHQESFWKSHQDDIVGWRSNIAYDLSDIEN